MFISIDPSTSSQLLKLKSETSIIKVLNVSKNSSTILINGIKIKLPVELKKNSLYILKNCNDKIELVETNIKDKELKKVILQTKEIDNNLFDQIFKDCYIEEKEVALQNLIWFIMQEKEKNDVNITYNKNNKKIIKKKYNFFLSLDFFNKKSNTFIEIGDTKVFLSIFTDSAPSEKEREIFKKSLAKNLTTKGIKEIIVNIFDKKENFYNNIKEVIGLNKIDLKI